MYQEISLRNENFVQNKKIQTRYYAFRGILMGNIVGFFVVFGIHLFSLSKYLQNYTMILFRIVFIIALSFIVFCGVKYLLTFRKDNTAVQKIKNNYILLFLFLIAFLIQFFFIFNISIALYNIVSFRTSFLYKNDINFYIFNIFFLVIYSIFLAIYLLKIHRIWKKSSSIRGALLVNFILFPLLVYVSGLITAFLNDFRLP